MGKKGNTAELEVARILEPWWRQLEPEAAFVRTPRSGGWTQGRDLFDARGDLMVKLAPRFPWCVEVKRREAWSLQNFEDGRSCPVWGWWEQSCNDAFIAKRVPMLWFRQNLRPWIVVVPMLLVDHRKIGKPDFMWTAAVPGTGVWPIALWEDRFLATHPRDWL